MNTIELTINKNGETRWRMNGDIHRKGAPAIIYPPDELRHYYMYVWYGKGVWLYSKTVSF